MASNLLRSDGLQPTLSTLPTRGLQRTLLGTEGFSALGLPGGTLQHLHRIRPSIEGQTSLCRWVDAYLVPPQKPVHTLV